MTRNRAIKIGTEKFSLIDYKYFDKHIQWRKYDLEVLKHVFFAVVPTKFSK